MLAAIYRGDARPSPQRRRWRRRSAQPAVRCWLALAARWRRRSAQPAVVCGAGGDARSRPPRLQSPAARLGPARSAALAATLGAARRRPPWPAPASVALACMAPAATLGAATLPSQPAAVARDDARHARDRGAGGDARRWELTVALPGLRPQRRWRGEPATFGVALPACSGGGDARPSPRLRRWRQRSTHQLAVALPGPRPQRRRWRRRSAQLAVALPGPHPQRRRWRGDARCRPPRLQRWLGLHPPRTLPLGRGEPTTQARRGCGLTRM